MKIEGTAPLIIGHRGAAGEAPENTLRSFQLAFEQGADAIELDIHLSADGELVVIHDHTIDRTTNGTGAVADLTLSELKRYDAGGWFHEQFAGEQIPTLLEVFEIVPKDRMVNIEIKAKTGGSLEAKLIALLRRTGMMEQAVVSSFNHKVLKHLKQIAPEVKIGLLYTANFVDHRICAEGFGAPVFSLHPHYSMIDLGDVQLATESGMQVYPYTMNNEADMRAFIQAGVSGIITDFPGRLHQLLSRNE